MRGAGGRARLQQARELGVAVGHVRAARLAQRGDHVAQRHEALVDLHALAELLPRRARLLHALAACAARSLPP